MNRYNRNMSVLLLIVIGLMIMQVLELRSIDTRLQCPSYMISWGDGKCTPVPEIDDYTPTEINIKGGI